MAVTNNATSSVTKKKTEVTDSTGLKVSGAGETTSNGMLADGSASTSSLMGVNANSDLQALTNALVNQYNNAQYQARTNNQRQSQAEQEYKAYYDSLNRAAQQSYDTNDLALQQERDALQASYDRNRQDSLSQYAQSYSQTDRSMLSRGMQRSSYGAQTLANVLNASAAAQDDINRQQTEAETNVDQKRTQLASQLAETLSGYESEKAEAILARMNELEQQDYDRGVAAANTQTNIATQLYSNIYNAQKDQVDKNLEVAKLNQAQNNTNKTYGWDMGSNFVNASGINTNGDSYYNISSPTKNGKDVTKNSSSSSSSGGGSSGGTGTTTKTTTSSGTTTSQSDDFKKLLNSQAGGSER